MSAPAILQYERIERAAAFYAGQPGRVFGTSPKLTGQHIAEHLTLLQAYCTEEKISVQKLTCQYNLETRARRSLLVFDIRTTLEFEDCDFHSIRFGLKCLTTLQTPDNLLFRFVAAVG